MNKTTKTTAMTKNSSSYTVHATVITDNHAARYVYIDRKKAYFMGDLVAAHGRGFVKHLPKAPCMLRIKDGSNSQNRRIVAAADFKLALDRHNSGNATKAARTSKCTSTRCTTPCSSKKAKTCSK